MSDRLPAAVPCHPNIYTLEDLMREGFSLRTIRYYRYRRLIPPAIGRGVDAHYSYEHIKRLREIKAAKDQRATLRDLNERFNTKVSRHG